MSQLALPYLAQAAPVSPAPRLPELPQKIALQPIDVESVSSPDGASCASVIYKPYQQTNITLTKSSDCSKVFEAVFPGRISSIQWLADNQTIVFLARAHSNSPIHLYSCNGKRKLARDLTPFGFRSVDKFWLSRNRKVLIASINLNEQSQYERFLVDTLSGAIEPLGSHRRYAGVSVEEKEMLITTAEWPAIAEPRIIYKTTSNPTRGNGFGRTLPVAIGTIVSGPINLTIPGQEEFKNVWNGNADQRLNVLDPTPKLEKETKITLKPWNAVERKLVKSIWQQICDQLPGFAMRACHGRKISLVRVSQYKSVGGELALGAAVPEGIIILPDKFFAENLTSQLDTMVHELAHECDNYGALSRSKEWLSLVRENIQACRAAKSYSKKHGLLPLDDQGAVYFGLPSIYASSAVSECLATWTSAVSQGCKAPAAIEKFLVEKVANPFCAEEALDKLILNSSDDYTAGRYQSSIQKLHEVLRRQPGSISAWHFLELSYSKTHNLKMALIASNKVLSLAAELRLIDDPYFKLELAEYYHRHACLLWEAKDFENARKFARKATDLAPAEKAFRDFEDHLRQKSPKVVLGKLGILKVRSSVHHW
ncbi:MAG: hypothetical protein JST01_07975 [Cyanobacteria bacterium SZAS TMP-1]|nr:hypothetical protein [Cyanobacteria bacterium SZAS TMP-1]